MALHLSPSPALLVIDMQNGFCHADGSFARLGMRSPADAIIPNINALRSACHTASIPVFFLRTAYKADYSDRRSRSRGDSLEKLHGLIEGSWDAEILDELRPETETNADTDTGADAGEKIITKTRNSGFFGTGVERLLKDEYGIDHLILTGVGTDVCVETTARDAYQMDFGVTTVSDATATCTEEDHRAALHALRLFGGTATTGEVLEALGRRGG